MKISNYLFAIAIAFGFAACSSSEADTADTNKTEGSKNQAKLMGQKVPAPVINIGEFSKMSKADLRLARNTIFAKYGRVFKSKDLKEHFAKQDWYSERPAFKESDMNQQDVDLVRIVQNWEEKTAVLLEERADFTGNGSYESCFVLYNENKGIYTVILNDFCREFNHFWGQNDDPNGLPSDWAEIQAEIIDIDPEDFKQELRISQRYDDWEDPGTHNVIVAFDKGVQVTELGSTNYDSGILTLNNDGTATMQQSNCPEHTKDFQLEKGKLVMFDETIGPMPKGGCAACFSGESLVATSTNTSKRIDELNSGDLVLTYDATSQSYRETRVERILSVYHENLMKINFGETELIVTDDHPFLTETGWCSFNPEMTMKRYGYANVSTLNKDSKLIGLESEKTAILNFERLDEGMMTYTISTLEKGTNFLVNGIVVGTESADTSSETTF